MAPNAGEKSNKKRVGGTWEGRLFSSVADPNPRSNSKGSRDGAEGEALKPVYCPVSF